MSDITKFDNFAPDAEAVREQVIAGQFDTHRGPDGADYTGISMFPVPHWPELIAKHLGKKIIPRLSCFRLNLENELPHSWVHSDDICARYASVLYLNPDEQCFGGTAFWKHKLLDIDRLPARGTLREPDAFNAFMCEDWKDMNLWQRTGLVAMKFNRFITYRTNLFHSRFPFEGFGQDARNGRLIWICFYDIENEVQA